MEVIPEYKIILLGEPGVGKTNFFFRLRDGVFVGSTASTVSTGIEHMEYKISINGSTVKVSPGAWHLVQLERKLSTLELALALLMTALRVLVTEGAL